MDNRKYIFSNGVIKVNPQYSSRFAQLSTLAVPNEALTIVSSTQDILKATEAGYPMQLSALTISSMQIMQDESFINRFHSNKIKSGDLLDGLSNVFAKYKIPIGLINKLLQLVGNNLDFIIDDSGSMGCPGETLISQASEYIKGKSGSNQNTKLTRWEEVEDSIHVMIDVLAYIPVNVMISFLNRPMKISLDHTGKSPFEFAKEAHEKIREIFNSDPCGATPICKKLSEAFSRPSENTTLHYLFTDGEPSDATPSSVANLVLNRSNPNRHLFTIINCSDNDNAIEYLFEIEKRAPFVSMLDKFISERQNVLRAQGSYFPFSRGVWQLLQLLKVLNPNDLGMLNKEIPFSKLMMDNFFGKKLSVDEYKKYFISHPRAGIFANCMNEFLREDITVQEIIQHDHLAANVEFENWLRQIDNFEEERQEILQSTGNHSHNHDLVRSLLLPDDEDFMEITNNPVNINKQPAIKKDIKMEETNEITYPADLCDMFFSYELMKDPVFCLLDNKTYEKANILEWLLKNKNSPHNRTVLGLKKPAEVLVSNKTLKLIIDDLDVSHSSKKTSTDYHCCPLTKKPFIKPLICILDGVTYEGAAITEYLQKNKKTPGNVLLKPHKISDVLKRNLNLESVLEEFAKANELAKNVTTTTTTSSSAVPSQQGFWKNTPNDKSVDNEKSKQYLFKK